MWKKFWMEEDRERRIVIICGGIFLSSNLEDRLMSDWRMATMDRRVIVVNLILWNEGVDFCSRRIFSNSIRIKFDELERDEFNYFCNDNSVK